MARAPYILLLALLLCVSARAQEAEPPLPPEEDQTFAAPREYSFNPLQAKKELTIGKFYFKKGSFKAAALRAQEAIKWDDSLLDAYLMLGESRERLRDTDGARQAYSQFLEIAGDNVKERKEIEKRLQKLVKADEPAKLSP
ncbi:MAG: hypothetical protein U5J83_04495 [Bryobacterales bacterium]|nr:hypothetical protein [Bryobacterales bacterium]